MERVGKYELIRKLAMGGMAEVFLARFEWARGLEKTVVVKRILPHLAEDPAFREMFFGEAQLAAQLNHPGIAQIIEFGESEGTYFLSMEYVDGPSLRTLEKAVRARKEHLPFAHCARIAASCCEALAHAHELVDAATGQPLNLVHRDVSPDNILISRNGAVKVVDFGIAKAATQTHQTQTGLVKGKVAFMSPEQLRAGPLDRRSDVYALGVVLYEMIGGGRPYEAPSDLTLMNAMLAGAMVPLRSRRPDVPEALERIVNRALQRNRDDRYPDCRAMAAELEEALIAGRQPASAFQIAQLVERYGDAAQRPDSNPAQALVTPEKPHRTAQTPEPQPASGTDAGRDAAALEQPLARTGTGDREHTIRQPAPRPPPRLSGSRLGVASGEKVAAEEPTLPRAAPPQRPGPPQEASSEVPGPPKSRRLVIAAALSAAGALAIAVTALRSGPAASNAPIEKAPATPAAAATAPAVTAAVPAEAPTPPAPVAQDAPPPAVEAAAPPSPPPPDQRPPAPAERVAPPPPARSPPRAAAPRLVELALRSDPPSQLKVMAGRKVLAEGRNSITAKVAPGTVVVEAWATGENSFLKRETLTLDASDKQVSHTITVRQGSVMIRTFPAAHVTVDGIPRGDVPLKLSVFEGQHVVRLECDRNVPLCAAGLVVTKPIVVEPGKDLEVMHKWQ